MAALAAAMGIGRFAFTPLLPLMLHDGVVDIATGSWLATANYAGYLAGALLYMALPWLGRRLGAVPGNAALVRAGLVATALLTATLALPWAGLWPLMRFLAVAGTIAMFLVGGGILTHGLPFAHHAIEAAAHSVAGVAGIGALQHADLARYNPDSKQLETIPGEDEQVEVLSLIGQITPRDGVANVHIHVVLGRHDGSTRGGHLVRAVVRPMLLLTVAESSCPLPPHHGQ